MGSETWMATGMLSCPQASHIGSRIVYFDEAPGCDVLAQIEPERLQNLQPSRSRTLCLFNLLGLQFWILRVFGSCGARLGKGIEPSGIRAVIFLHRFGQAIVISARQVDHRTNI